MAWQRLISLSAPEKSSQQVSPAEVSAAGRWMVLARIAWIVVAVVALLSIATGLVLLYQQLTSIGSTTAYQLWQLSAADAKALQSLGSSLDFYAQFRLTFQIVLTASFFLVAAIILWHGSRSIVAFLASFTLLSFGTTLSWPAVQLLANSQQVLFLPAILLIASGYPLLILFLYFFPDGRSIPRETQIPVLLGSLSLVVWTIATRGDVFGPLNGLLLVTLMLGGVASQVYRYIRLSNLAQRQQTKWVLFGIVIVVAGFVLSNGHFGPITYPSGSFEYFFVRPVLNTVAIAIPVTLGFAILRYRLWDIDFIINRTLVYVSLSAIVIAIYVLLVGVLGALFQASGSLAISLLATGVVAVLFQPMREQLQRGVNHLVYGERDNPYAVITRLGERVQTTLVPESVLAGVVETITQALKLSYAAIALTEQGAPVAQAHYASTKTRQGKQHDNGVGVGVGVGVTLQTPPESLRVLPLLYQGEVVGELQLALRSGETSLSPVDRRLLENLAQHIGVIVHAYKLSTDLKSARARLVTAREEERRRLRRDLHDGLGPTLASQALTLDTARLLLERDHPDPVAAATLLRVLKTQMQESITDIRRLVYALRPPALDDLGLVGALRELTEQYNGPGIQVGLVAPDTLLSLSAAIEVAVYRIVGEALTNVVRHSAARNCEVSLMQEGAGLRVRIVDDGVGLPAKRRAGVGLSSMRERAEELGGTCSFDLNSPGGTDVVVWLPI
jgi:signal transduction histidine kinase